MADNYNNYGFCPKCGALMRDGVCPSCGFKDWGGQNGYSGQNTGGQYSQNGYYGQNGGPGGYYGQNPYDGRPPKKSRKKLVIGLCIAGFVILVIIAAVLFVNVFRRFNGMSGSDYYYGFEDPEGGYGGDDDFWYYDEGSDGTYVPDEDDAYYEEITDSTRTDLSYGIVWRTETLYPDDTENTEYFYANYPLILSDSDEYDALNELIETEALKYEDTYREYGSVNVLGYVTYMDEDLLSVVFKFTCYDSEESLYVPTISALTFDMETLEVIPHDEMATIDDELVLRFRAQDSTQNGGVDFVQDATDDELLELLGDEEASVYFYTPVGLEVGINYDGGWVTVTLKDQAL